MPDLLELGFSDPSIASTKQRSFDFTFHTVSHFLAHLLTRSAALSVAALKTRCLRSLRERQRSISTCMDNE